MYAKTIAGLVVLFLLSPVGYAADPPPVLEISGPNVVEVGKKCIIKVQTTAKKVTWKVPAGCDTEALDGRRLAVWALPGSYTFVAMVPSGDDVLSIDYVLTIVGPRPPPDPTPDPKPPDPKPPQPVTSFRVIFTKESGQVLPAAQSSIPGAKSIRDYLARKTTPEGGLQGWREYDPQVNTTNEQPNMKALWESVKPKVTTVPNMVVEVNGDAKILPFPASVDACLATLKQYGGP